VVKFPTAFVSRIVPLVAFLVLSAPAGAGQIRGRILVAGPADKPVSGVTISAVPWETPGDEARREMKGGEPPKPIASATSGADGSFVLAVPPAEPGREKDREKNAEKLFRVRVEGAGIVPVLFEGVYDASETEDLGEHTLPHGEKLSGIAVDVAGKPLGGATVALEPGVAGGDDLAYRVVTRTVVTGEDGTFRFDEASATGNRITIEKTSLAPARETGLKAGAVPRPITVAVGDPVTGVVLGANKKPSAGALVRLESSKATTRWVETDADGRFTIPHAPAGRGAIVVDAGEAGWGSRPDVKLPLGEGKSLTIALAPPASLDGKVVDDKTGRAVPRAKVFVKANGFACLARTGPDGLYHLKGIPPQTYRLSVDEARYVAWLKPDVALAPGESRRLDVAITLSATMIGKVVDENGAPVSAARGTFTRGGENAIAGIRRMLRVGGETTAFRTRADGTFKATRLAPGDNQRLFVSHADFESATLAGLSLPSGGTKGDVAIVMRRGATISGVVKDANDQPIADVEVQVDPSVNFRARAGGMAATFARLGGPGVRPKAKTAADGTFHITGMSVGEYALQVRKPGFANERVDPVKVTDKGADPVAVTLGPGAAIAGIVRKKNGEGAEGYLVRVGTGGRGAAGAGGPFAGTGTDLATGPDGLFVIEGLKPGQVYDLSVFGGVGLGPQKRGVVAPAANVDLLVAGTGRIAGTAVDARSGQPLKNFSVSYEPDRGGGAIIRLVARGAGVSTGIGQKRDFNTEDGSFALEDVPAGTWTVVVESKGYQQARVANLAVEENGSKDQVEVRATPGVVLKGRVSDARSGRPVANASITHEAAGSGGGPGGFGGFGGRGGPFAGLDGADDVTTDAEGNFEIEGVSVGRLKVTAKNPDYTDGSEVAEVKETGGTVEIKLTSGGSASGVVVASNQPLPNADVALSAAGDTGFGRILGGGQTTTSDATGRFHFDHLGAGRYSVSAGMNGKSSDLSEFVLQAGDSKSDLVLSLSSGSTIQGTVSGLPDAMRSGATVLVTGVQAFFANTKVGADGSFSVTGVPAGPVTLRAQAGDGLGTSRSATKQVTASDDVPVLQTEIVFDVGFTLSGHVMRASQPVANAVVVANLQGGGGRQATTRTDDGGGYTLSGLQEGAYTVTAMGDPLAGGGSQVRQTVSLTADQSLDLTFPMAKVAGVVTDADTKQPLADATVSLSSAGGTGSVAPAMQRMATTDSNGHFQFTDVVPQDYTLNSQKTDYQFDKRSLTAADDGTSENVSVELLRGQGIGIQVRDGIYGVPMRSVMARVLDGSQSTVFTGSIALDTGGAGEIPSLKPGGYAVFVNASGYATQYLASVSAPSQQPVPITLTPGGSADIAVGPKSFVKGILRGTLKTAAGVPYPYTLFATDGRVSITADASGQTGFRRLTNLAPGSYVLTLDGGGGTTFNISEGGITPVPLP
jgi:hypothetical protein